MLFFEVTQSYSPDSQLVRFFYALDKIVGRKKQRKVKRVREVIAEDDSTSDTVGKWHGQQPGKTSFDSPFPSSAVTAAWRTVMSRFGVAMEYDEDDTVATIEELTEDLVIDDDELYPRDVLALADLRAYYARLDEHIHY